MKAEGWVMLIHYITAIILVIVLTAHLLLHSPFIGLNFETSLNFDIAKSNLQGLSPLFALLVIAAVIHGVNGLRILLLELSQNKGWSIFVNILAVILTIALLVVGLSTLVGVLG